MDELDLIRHFSPATEGPTTETLRKVLAAVAGRIEQPRPALRRAGGRHPFSRGRLSLVLAVAACALAALLVSLRLGAGTTETAVAEVLTRAASAVSEQRLGKGQYYFERFRIVVPLVNQPVPGHEGESYRANFSSEGVSWIDARGSGRVRSVQRLEFPTLQDRALWEAAGAPSVGPAPLGLSDRRVASAETSNTAFAYFGLTLKELLALAQNPPDLSARLAKAAANPVKHRLAITNAPAPGLPTSEAGLILALLGSDNQGVTPPLPPRLAGALYGVLARQPNVKLQAHVQDRAGRPGVEVSSGAVAMIFDARTYRLLESRSPCSCGPWYTLILHSGVASSERAG